MVYRGFWRERKQVIKGCRRFYSQVGARVINFLVTDDLEVYLAFIVDKSQFDNLTKDKITELLKIAGLI